jgi:hypothetical protein
MTTKWIKRWEVLGRSGNTWIVAVDRDGNYGCSCPAWIYRRKICHHILQIQENPTGILAEIIADRGDDFNPFQTRYQMIVQMRKEEGDHGKRRHIESSKRVRKEMR